MIYKLSDLEIEEVSLVDVPANNKHVIYKALDTGDKMTKKITKAEPPVIPGPEKKPEDEEEELEEAGMPEKSASASAAEEAAAEVKAAAEEAEHAAEQAVAAAEAAEHVAEAVLGAEPKAPEGPAPEMKEAEAGVPAEDDGKYAPEGEPAPEIRPQEGEDPMVEEEEEEDKEQVDDAAPKYCDQCGKELEDGKCAMCAEKHAECVGKAKKPPVGKKGGKKPKLTEVEKAVVELQKAQMKIAELEKTAMEAKHALIQKEFVEKASKEFGHIPGVSSEQLGVVLKHASEAMAPEHYTTLNTVLKAAEAVLAQNILTQTIGVKADARTNDGSAASRLHARATEIMGTVQKSGEKITYEKAYMKAMNENPALYQEYLSGK